ncbi:cortexin domain-containing 1 protein-like [Lethenteron reissneri]|uniref:cortexin domain-containing 1 protein-like n=1 Tax=Lethenteron reissneri TaxID=7753 RepID=UPI002AB79C2F|nr:cortexin domain-containing 1 protein-like [Lethenteron reissneri]
MGMESRSGAELPPIDLDKGLAFAFLSLLCLFLLIMIVKCVKVVLDPYSEMSTSSWEEQRLET